MTVAVAELAPYVEEILAIDFNHQSLDDALLQVERVVAAWCQRRDYLEPQHQVCQTEEDHHVLYVAEDGSLMILLIVWAPGHTGVVHDHKTWAVVGCIQGAERHQLWRRTDDLSKTGYATLEKEKEVICTPGEIITMRPNHIHSVTIPEQDEVTIALHVYGKDLRKIGRSKFNTEDDSVELMTTLK